MKKSHLGLHLNSLDFAVNSFFMKLCQSYFSSNLPSVLLKNRAEKFDIKYNKKLDHQEMR